MVAFEREEQEKQEKVCLQTDIQERHASGVTGAGVGMMPGHDRDGALGREPEGTGRTSRPTMRRERQRGFQ